MLCFMMEDRGVNEHDKTASLYKPRQREQLLGK